jgi:hypothetical protein
VNSKVVEPFYQNRELVEVDYSYNEDPFRDMDFEEPVRGTFVYVGQRQPFENLEGWLEDDWREN